jgi:hypothetical protein
MKTFWEFTITRVIAGLILGWLLSLVSGNTLVVFIVATLGSLVGVILGTVNRNASRMKN